MILPALAAGRDDLHHGAGKSTNTARFFSIFKNKQDILPDHVLFPGNRRNIGQNNIQP
jgi:hypothetical protein